MAIIKTMKILLDALGGDKAPTSTVEGATKALLANPDLHLVLAGPETELRPLLEKQGAPLDRLSFLDASEVVLNTDHPATLMKEKPNSSLAVAFEELRKNGEIDALVSAGPTGALLSGTVLRIGRIPGVQRPGLLAAIPTRTGKLCYLIDVGANMDCKPEYLYQFALMADAYLKALGYESPRISVLSVGQEEGKGNELTKTVYAMLKERSDLNFIGNIEGDHVLKGETDIVVCDGFSGNVFLKSMEEAAYYISDLFKAAIFKNVFTKLGALPMIGGLKKVKAPFDYASRACSPLLGAKKLVLKCHGKSDAVTIAATIAEAVSLKEKGLIASIGSALEKPSGDQ